jgi:uncharacterized membrane protein
VILLALFGILIGSYTLLTIVARVGGMRQLNAQIRGRVSLALLFFITGLGHFVKTDEMVQMLPPWVPMRMPLIYVTGVLEWAGALGLLLPRVSRVAGMCLLAFLVVVFPANIYAAVNRVAMGGHESGSMYLLVRGPFQALLVWWAYWFAVRKVSDGGHGRSAPGGRGLTGPGTG